MKNRLGKLYVVCLFIMLSLVFVACSGKEQSANNIIDDDYVIPTIAPEPVIQPAPTIAELVFPSPAPMFEWKPVNDEGTIASYKLQERTGIKQGTALVDIGDDKAIYVCDVGGTSDIYEVDFENERIHKKCNIDVDPSEMNQLKVCKDGRKAVFNNNYSDKNELIIFDEDFNILKRIDLIDASYSRQLTDDFSKVIYCVYDEESNTKLMIMDVESGEVKDCTNYLTEAGVANDFFVYNLIFDSEIVVIYSYEDGFKSCYYLVDINEGIVLERIYTESLSMKTVGDKFLATYSDGSTHVLFGDRTSLQDIKGLIYYDYEESYDNELLNDMIFTSSSEYTKDNVYESTLACYDVSTEKCSSRVTFDFGDSLQTVRMPAVWYEPRKCAYGLLEVDGVTYLYKWDVMNEKNNINTERAVSYKFNLDGSVDETELANIQDYADAISEKYKVKILTGDLCDEAVGTYKTSPLKNICLITNSLEEIDSLLSEYPADLIDQINYQGTKPFKIQLIGGLEGMEGENVISNAIALYNDEGDEHNIALDCSSREGFRSNFYHEMSHAIDYYIFDNYGDYYNEYDSEWVDLNDNKYYYDYSYVDNAYTNLNGTMSYEDNKENVYFHDSYAKSYPTEDRARLMEYALTYGISYYEEYPHMMEKLKYMYRTILKTFNTENWKDGFFEFDDWFDEEIESGLDTAA